MGDALAAVDLGLGERAIAVEAGFFHTCALLYEGDVKCWGKVSLLLLGGFGTAGVKCCFAAAGVCMLLG